MFHFDFVHYKHHHVCNVKQSYMLKTQIYPQLSVLYWPLSHSHTHTPLNSPRLWAESIKGLWNNSIWCGRLRPASLSSSTCFLRAEGREWAAASFESLAFFCRWGPLCESLSRMSGTINEPGSVPLELSRQTFMSLVSLAALVLRPLRFSRNMSVLWVIFHIHISTATHELWLQYDLSLEDWGFMSQEGKSKWLEGTWRAQTSTEAEHSVESQAIGRMSQRQRILKTIPGSRWWWWWWSGSWPISSNWSSGHFQPLLKILKSI